MAQSDLSPEDAGRPADGDAGQPVADHAVHADPASAALPGELDGAGPGQQQVAEGGFQPVTPLPAGAPGWTGGIPGGNNPDLAPPAPGPKASSTLDKFVVLRDELFAWVKTLFSAAVYATLIVTFGFQVARVEGLSMAPTLQDQDRLIVNKLIYRLSSPRRNDIVMLYYPANPDKSFVKRVVAEEGDTIRIVDGRVYVNDIPIDDSYVPEEYRSHDNLGPLVIPEGYYFVMGDHRNNSSDSRHWGMVPKKYIIGKVQVRWWPVPKATVFP